MSLLTLSGVSQSYGTALLDGVSLQILPGERVCLLGRNGAGKSTLLKIIAGDLSADEGVVSRQRMTRVALLAQELPDDLAGRLEGKSSLGRLGLLTHSTAGVIDPGFTGHITLELSNVANLPITLWPGMKIGQLCLIKLSSPAEFPYGSASVGSKYQGQRGPTPSKAYLNFSHD